MIFAEFAAAQVRKHFEAVTGNFFALLVSAVTNFHKMN